MFQSYCYQEIEGLLRYFIVVGINHFLEILRVDIRNVLSDVELWSKRYDNEIIGLSTCILSSGNPAIFILTDYYFEICTFSNSLVTSLSKSCITITRAPYTIGNSQKEIKISHIIGIDRFILGSHDQYFVVDVNEIDIKACDTRLIPLRLTVDPGKDYQALLSDNFILICVNAVSNEHEFVFHCKNTFTQLNILRWCEIIHEMNSIRVIWEANLPATRYILLSDVKQCPGLLFVITNFDISVFNSQGNLVKCPFPARISNLCSRTIAGGVILNTSVNGSYTLLLSLESGDFEICTINSILSADSMVTLHPAYVSSVTVSFEYSHLDQSIQTFIPFFTEMFSINTPSGADRNSLQLFVGFHPRFGMQLCHYTTSTSADFTVDDSDYHKNNNDNSSLQEVHSFIHRMALQQNDDIFSFDRLHQIKYVVPVPLPLLTTSNNSIGVLSRLLLCCHHIPNDTINDIREDNDKDKVKDKDSSRLYSMLYGGSVGLRMLTLERVSLELGYIDGAAIKLFGLSPSSTDNTVVVHSKSLAAVPTVKTNLSFLSYRAPSHQLPPSATSSSSISPPLSHQSCSSVWEYSDSIPYQVILENDIKELLDSNETLKVFMVCGERYLVHVSRYNVLMLQYAIGSATENNSKILRKIRKKDSYINFNDLCLPGESLPGKVRINHADLADNFSPHFNSSFSEESLIILSSGPHLVVLLASCDSGLIPQTSSSPNAANTKSKSNIVYTCNTPIAAITSCRIRWSTTSATDQLLIVVSCWDCSDILILGCQFYPNNNTVNSCKLAPLQILCTISNSSNIMTGSGGKGSTSLDIMRYMSLLYLQIPMGKELNELDDDEGTPNILCLITGSESGLLVTYNIAVNLISNVFVDKLVSPPSLPQQQPYMMTRNYLNMDNNNNNNNNNSNKNKIENHFVMTLHILGSCHHSIPNDGGGGGGGGGVTGILPIPIKKRYVANTNTHDNDSQLLKEVCLGGILIWTSHQTFLLHCSLPVSIAINSTLTFQDSSNIRVNASSNMNNIWKKTLKDVMKKLSWRSTVVFPTELPGYLATTTTSTRYDSIHFSSFCQWWSYQNSNSDDGRDERSETHFEQDQDDLLYSAISGSIRLPTSLSSKLKLRWLEYDPVSHTTSLCSGVILPTIRTFVKTNDCKVLPGPVVSIAVNTNGNLATGTSSTSTSLCLLQWTSIQNNRQHIHDSEKSHYGGGGIMVIDPWSLNILWSKDFYGLIASTLAFTRSPFTNSSYNFDESTGTALLPIVDSISFVLCLHERHAMTSTTSPTPTPSQNSLVVVHYSLIFNKLKSVESLSQNKNSNSNIKSTQKSSKNLSINFNDNTSEEALGAVRISEFTSILSSESLLFVTQLHSLYRSSFISGDALIISNSQYIAVVGWHNCKNLNINKKEKYVTIHEHVKKKGPRQGEIGGTSNSSSHSYSSSHSHSYSNNMSDDMKKKKHQLMVLAFYKHLAMDYQLIEVITEPPPPPPSPSPPLEESYDRSLHTVDKLTCTADVVGGIDGGSSSTFYGRFFLSWLGEGIEILGVVPRKTTSSSNDNDDKKEGGSHSQSNNTDTNNRNYDKTVLEIQSIRMIKMLGIFTGLLIPLSTSFRGYGYYSCHFLSQTAKKTLYCFNRLTNTVIAVGFGKDYSSHAFPPLTNFPAILGVENINRQQQPSELLSISFRSSDDVILEIIAHNNEDSNAMTWLRLGCIPTGYTWYWEEESGKGDALYTIMAIDSRGELNNISPIS